jgi:hypothetical protein
MWINVDNYSIEKQKYVLKATDYILHKNHQQCYDNMKTLKEYYDDYSEISEIRKNNKELGNKNYTKEIRIQSNYGEYTKNENGEKVDLSFMFPYNKEVIYIGNEISKWARKKYKVFRRHKKINKDDYEEEGKILSKELQKELKQYGIFVTFYTIFTKNKVKNKYNEELKDTGELLVMADYGSAYLWNDRGEATSLFGYLSESEIVNELENELDEWSGWFWDTVQKPNEDFPWDEFNKVGRELAKRVHHLVKDRNIPVYYAKAFEENGNHVEEPIIEEEIKDRLTEITIMADYDEYAWTNGVCRSIDISYYFPEISEIKNIEEELQDWIKIFLGSDLKSKEFDWEYFHARGRDLARRVHNALKEYNIPVYYWKPVEDNNGTESERELIV